MQEVTGSRPVPSTKTTRLIRVGSFCFGGRYRTRTARAERSEGNQSPSGALISARFPTARNVYQERCRQTIWSGDFFRGGRYRTRTAAEATAACGGNREPRLGPRSDFSKPCQGAAEKSANATRTGASRQIPSRFPTHRNVYQERCRQTIRSGDFFRGGWHRTRTGTSKGRVSSWRWYPAFCFDMFYQ